MTLVPSIHDAPFKGSIGKVKEEWIDYNGHFNMAYYAVLFDGCCDEAFSLVGLGEDYLKTSGFSYFTMEAQVNYLRELKAGDEVDMTLQLYDYDSKRIHFFLHMYDRKDGALSATMETLCMHIDMSKKKSCPWPEHIRTKLAQMYEAHKDLPTPKQLGHTIGIVRKVA